MPQDDEQPPASRGYGEGYEYVAVGFTLVAAILLLGGGGWMLDGWLHTRPLFAILGFLVAVVGWFLNLYYRVTRETDKGKGDGGRGKGKA